MRDLDVRIPRRVVGRQALEKSIRALLLRAHGYGQHRARTCDELQWAAGVIDGLTATLEASTSDTSEAA